MRNAILVLFVLAVLASGALAAFVLYSLLTNHVC